MSEVIHIWDGESPPGTWEPGGWGLQARSPPPPPPRLHPHGAASAVSLPLLCSWRVETIVLLTQHPSHSRGSAHADWEDGWTNLTCASRTRKMWKTGDKCMEVTWLSHDSAHFSKRTAVLSSQPSWCLRFEAVQWWGQPWTVPSEMSSSAFRGGCPKETLLWGPQLGSTGFLCPTEGRIHQSLASPHSGNLIIYWNQPGDIQCWPPSWLQACSLITQARLHVCPSMLRESVHLSN